MKPVGWILLGISAISGATWSPWAADITWRGGSSNDFHDRQNWNLPPDIPAGTPADERENFRRVPGSNDRAILAANDEVRVFQTSALAGLSHTGGELSIRAGARLTVTGNDVTLGASLSAVGGTAIFQGAVDLTGTLLRAENGGALQFSAPLPAIVSAVVIARGGEISFGGRTRFEAEVFVEDGGTLRVPTEGDSLAPSDFRAPVTLNALVQAQTSRLLGAYRAQSSISWIRGQVASGPILFESAARLELRGDTNPPVTAPFTWTGDNLTFGGEGGIVRQHRAVHRFENNLIFESGAGIPLGEAPIEFAGRIDVNRALTLGAPIVYAANAELHLNAAGAVLAGSSEITRNRRHLLHGGVIFVKADATLDFLTLDGGGIAFVPETATGLATLSVRGQGDFQFLDGTITQSRGRGVLEVTDVADLVLGGGSERNARAEVSLGCDLINRGTVIFAEDRARPNQTIRGEGTWINLGILGVPIGHGVAEGSRVHLVNFDLIRVSQRFIEPAEDFQRFSRLAFTLLNEPPFGSLVSPGRIEIDADVTVEIAQGENRGEIVVGDRSCLQIGTGIDESFTFQVDDQPEVTRTFSKRFVQRAGSKLEFGRGACLRLLSFGSFGFPQFLAGFETESAITVDRLEMGGPGGAQPGFFFSGPLTGRVLTVNETFAWFGGRLVGVSGADHQIELPVGSATDIRSTEESPGSEVVVHRCAVHHRGSMIINTANTVATFQGSLVNHPGGTILIQRARSVSGLVNEGSVTQNLEELDAEVRFADLRQRGSFKLEQGNAQFGSNTRIEESVEAANPSARVRLFEATLANATIVGAQKRIQGLTVEGRVRLENVVVEPKDGDFYSLKSIDSMPGQLELAGAVDWLGGGIDMPGGKVEFAENALVTVAPEDQFGRFTFLDRGQIDNRGKVTHNLNTTSRMRLGREFKWRNHPGSLYVTAGEGRVFVPQSDAFPGEFINDGGEVRFVIPEGQEQSLGAAYQQLNGMTQVKLPNGGNGPNSRSVSRQDVGPHAPQPKNRFRLEFDAFLDGGVASFTDTAFEAARQLLVNGGRVQLGDNSTAQFRREVSVTRGAIEFFSNSAGTFNAAFKVSGGVFDVGAGAEATARQALELTGSGVFSGLGQFIGAVNNVSGVISPGLNEALTQFGTLTVNGEVTFGSESTLELDVPVNVAAPEGDRLLVNGAVRLAGTVTVTPSLSPVLIESSAFYEALRFTSRQGEFANFVTLPLGDNKRFEPEFREDPLRFGFVVVSGGDGADLELTAGSVPVAITEAPVTLSVNVINRGPAGANQLGLDVTLPTGVTFIESATPHVLKDSGRVIGFNLATLNAGDTNVVTFTVRAPATTGVATLNAAVASQTPDPNPANNTLTIPLPTLGPDGVRISEFVFAGPGGAPQLRVATIPGVRYRLERSEDLEDWVLVEEFLGDGNERAIANLPNEAATGYFRLMVR